MEEKTVQNHKISDWIIYKNNQLIAFNKPPSIPVQSAKDDETSLLKLGEIYCKSRLNFAHRIDQPASGIVLFAKTPKALRVINEQFRPKICVFGYRC